MSAVVINSAPMIRLEKAKHIDVPEGASSFLFRKQSPVRLADY